MVDLILILLAGRRLIAFLAPGPVTTHFTRGFIPTTTSSLPLGGTGNTVTPLVVSLGRHTHYYRLGLHRTVTTIHTSLGARAPYLIACEPAVDATQREARHCTATTPHCTGTSGTSGTSHLTDLGPAWLELQLWSCSGNRTELSFSAAPTRLQQAPRPLHLAHTRHNTQGRQVSSPSAPKGRDDDDEGSDGSVGI